MQDRKFLGDGVVTGHAMIDNHSAYVFSHDFTVLGSLGMAFALKVCKVMDLALKQRVPIVGINDSGGALIQVGGVDSLAGYAEIFHRNVKASGVTPQIFDNGSLRWWRCVFPSLTDFVIMTRSAYMFVMGPEVVKEVTEEKVSFEDLRGAEIHNKKSGVAHFIANNEQECFTIHHSLLSFIPPNNLENPPTRGNKR